MGLLIAQLMIGAILYGVGVFGKNLEAWARKSLKWAGLLTATLGVMIWLSALYVNHTAWFYWPALILGAIVAALGFFSSDFTNEVKDRLRWTGTTLFVAGIVMAFLSAGLSLFAALVALAALVYFKLVKTGKAKQIISDVDRKLEQY